MPERNLFFKNQDGKYVLITEKNVNCNEIATEKREEETYQFTISKLHYDKKPSGNIEIGKIWNSLKPEELTLSELKSELEQGATITQYVECTDGVYFIHLILDIDNEDVERIITIDNAVNELEQHFGVKPMLYYESFSSTSEKPKFRLVYDLIDDIEQGVFTQLYKYLSICIPWIDPSLGQEKHIIFGTDKEVFINKDFEPIPLDIINSLIEKSECICESSSGIDYKGINIDSSIEVEYDVDYRAVDEKRLIDYVNHEFNIEEVFTSFYPSMSIDYQENSNYISYKCPYHSSENQGYNFIWYKHTNYMECKSHNCGTFYPMDVLKKEYKTNDPCTAYVNYCKQTGIDINYSYVEDKNCNVRLKPKNTKLGKKDNGIDWVDVDPKGKPLKTLDNLIVLLDYYNISFKFNSYSRDVEVYDPNGLLPMYVEGDLNSLQIAIKNLCIKCGFSLGNQDLGKYLDTIFINNEYNPFLDLIIEYENDNEQLLWDYFDSLIFDDEQEPWLPLYREYWIKWLLSVVHLQFNTVKTPKNAEFMLVLQGGQGFGKSYFGKNLLSPLPQLFQDGIKFNLKYNPDSTKRAIRKFAIVEIAELESTTGKNDQGDLKALITSSSDSFHELYVGSKVVPRKTVFFATVNGTEFLFDETGERRYAVMFGVIGKDRDKADSVDMKEFWGAVYHLYNTKYSHLKDKTSVLLDPEYQKLQAESNMRGKYHTSTYELITELYDFSIKDTTLWNVENGRDIVSYLNDNYDGYDKVTLKSVKHALSLFGIENKNHKIGGGLQKKGYKVPPRGCNNSHHVVRPTNKCTEDKF